MDSVVDTRDSRRGPSAKPAAHVSMEHPLRHVRACMDCSLGPLNGWLRAGAAPAVRCGIGSEQMVRALLLQFLFAIRRERQLLDQIWYSMLFRWFVGIRPDEPKWSAEVFAIYREQLLGLDMVRGVLLRGLATANRHGLLSVQALIARRRELAQYRSEVTVGIGHPAPLPPSRASRAGAAGGTPPVRSPEPGLALHRRAG